MRERSRGVLRRASHATPPVLLRNAPAPRAVHRRGLMIVQQGELPAADTGRLRRGR
jgi:hypothetical protein